MKRELQFLVLTGAVLVATYFLMGCITTPPPAPVATTSASNILAYNVLRYIDPKHVTPTVVVTNPAPPMPAGMASPGAVVTTNKVTHTLAALPVIVLPPPMIVTNTNYVEMFVPPDGQNQTTNPEMMLVQSSADLKTWKTLGSIRQISGSNVTAKLLSTNRFTFYRTVSQSNAIPAR